MKRLSVRPFLCPIIRPQPRRAAGLLLSAVRARDIDRQWLPPGAEQQRRRSTALSSKCELCHVDSRRRKLNTDLFVLPRDAVHPWY